ncbi:hypothetical protein CEXT_339981 [Caerostris extrusa]|uniref:Uncharacterized protein n=1 Tax=Caerostris extrusa TaxID=172846 RepID=A0AAV4QAA1_CAEEX|nr:hypothetical protein CEXT_339981 [Caerostris extrusa]
MIQTALDWTTGTDFISENLLCPENFSSDLTVLDWSSGTGFVPKIRCFQGFHLFCGDVFGSFVRHVGEKTLRQMRAPLFNSSMFRRCEAFGEQEPHHGVYKILAKK